MLIYWAANKNRQFMIIKTVPQKDLLIARSGEFVFTIVEPKLTEVIREILSKHLDNQTLETILPKIDDVIRGGVHFVLSTEQVAYISQILLHHVLEDHIQLTELRLQNLSSAFNSNSDSDSDSVLYR